MYRVTRTERTEDGWRFTLTLDWSDCPFRIERIEGEPSMASSDKTTRRDNPLKVVTPVKVPDTRHETHPLSTRVPRVGK